MHFMFIDYSEAIYKYLIEKNYELYSKNDLRFMECVYKILVRKKTTNVFNSFFFKIKEFNYKPFLNIN